MGFFKDFKDDFSQAVGELFPGDDFEDEEAIQVNTLDNELDVEQELSKLDGLLEQVEKRVVARSAARTQFSPEVGKSPQPAVERKPEPERKSESEIREALDITSGGSAKPEQKPEAKPEPKREERKPEPEQKEADKPEPEQKEADKPEPEPKKEIQPEPKKEGRPEIGDIPVEEPQLAPLVLDEPEPEEIPAMSKPESKSEPATAKPEPVAIKPEPKPEPVAAKPEPKSEPVVPKPESKSEPVVPKPEPKKEPTVSKPELTRVVSTENLVIEMPKRKPEPVISMTRPERRPTAQKAAVSFMQKPTPIVRESRPQTAPVPELPRTPGRPAAAWGDPLNQMKTNRSANIKEEKSMDTTVTATETPVVETAAESVAVPNEPMAPPAEVTDEVSLITAGTNIRGNMETTGSFEIEGRIEGDIKCNGKLTVIGSVVGNSASSEFFADAAHIEGEVVSSGTVKIGLGSVIIGNISATSAVIAGAVKGDIDVQGPVVVDTSAVIMGNIKSRSVQINNGAVIEGFCSQCYSDVDVESLFNKN